MPENINLITGATGLLGSHIAEQLVARGEKVRALVRPATDTTFLKHLGVQLYFENLEDVGATAFTGVDTLYHCASRVGDFGTWKMFQAEVVELTRHVLEAAQLAGVTRVLHVSSVAVCGHRPRIPPGGLTEEQSLSPGFGDHYGRAKVAAELVAQTIRPDVTIVRPTWMIGPRDRHGLGRLLQALRGGWVSLVGSGENLLNIVHAADVARGAILAAKSSQSQGQIYNLCSAGEITQRQFLDTLCDAQGIPRVSRRIPFRLAYFGGFLSEIIARVLRFQRAPFISRYTVSRLGRSTAYRSDKAHSQLGWAPQINILDGLHQILTSLK